MSLIEFTPKPFHRVDMADIPVAAVLEQSDYETILSELKQNFLQRVPADEREYFTAALALESEPLLIQLQACAYRELHLRERQNSALKAIMLSEASGSNLDAIAANPPWGVQRLAGEQDERFRQRIMLSTASAASAGSRDDYRFYALSADVNLFDCELHSPSPGVVEVYLLAENDTAPQSMVDNVMAVLTDDQVRPLTDHVIVKPAEMIDYAINANLYLYEGPDKDIVLGYANSQLNALLAVMFRFGYDMSRSAIESALHVGGVQRVELLDWQDIHVPLYQAARCIDKNVEVVGRAE